MGFSSSAGGSSSGAGGSSKGGSSKVGSSSAVIVEEPEISPQNDEEGVCHCFFGRLRVCACLVATLADSISNLGGGQSAHGPHSCA